MSNISFVVRKFDNTENEKYVFSDFHFLDCVCVCVCVEDRFVF